MDAIDVQDRIAGCLLGGAAGDALGEPIEFLSTAELRRRYGDTGPSAPLTDRVGEAHVSDDTQMTLFTAEGLIRCASQARHTGSADAATALHGAYARWLTTQQRPWPSPTIEPGHPDGWLIGQDVLHQLRAPGMTCLGALAGGRRGKPTQPLNESKGCGGIMRAAPAGFGPVDAGEAFRLGAEAAAITHGGPGGYLPAGVVAAAVAGVLQGASLREALLAARDVLVGWDGHVETLQYLDLALERSGDGLPSPEELDGIHPQEKPTSGWMGPDALGVAVWCALGTDDPVAGLRASVHHGGDSDSTGAITGNLLGVVHGRSVVPLDWLEVIDAWAVVEAVAADAHAHLWRGDDPGEAGTEPASWRYPPW